MNRIRINFFNVLQSLSNTGFLITLTMKSENDEYSICKHNIAG